MICSVQAFPLYNTNSKLKINYHITELTLPIGCQHRTSHLDPNWTSCLESVWLIVVFCIETSTARLHVSSSQFRWSKAICVYCTGYTLYAHNHNFKIAVFFSC